MPLATAPVSLERAHLDCTIMARLAHRLANNGIAADERRHGDRGVRFRSARGYSRRASFDAFGDPRACWRGSIWVLFLLALAAERQDIGQTAARRRGAVLATIDANERARGRILE
jgi:hypothetical protein